MARIAKNATIATCISAALTLGGWAAFKATQGGDAASGAHVGGTGLPAVPPASVPATGSPAVGVIASAGGTPPVSGLEPTDKPVVTTEPPTATEPTTVLIPPGFVFPATGPEPVAVNLPDDFIGPRLAEPVTVAAAPPAPVVAAPAPVSPKPTLSEWLLAGLTPIAAAGEKAAKALAEGAAKVPVTRLPSWYSQPILEARVYLACEMDITGSPAVPVDVDCRMFRDTSATLRDELVKLHQAGKFTVPDGADIHGAVLAFAQAAARRATDQPFPRGQSGSYGALLSGALYAAAAELGLDNRFLLQFEPRPIRR